MTPPRPTASGVALLALACAVGAYCRVQLVAATEAFPPATGTPLSLRVVSSSRSAAHGAACLDGTPPAYYLLRSATASTQWIVFLEGGGWCFTAEECAARAKGYLGTSNNLRDSMVVGGLLSDDETVNPDFHDWNMVFVHYCDGSSYSGGASATVAVGNATLHFRGRACLSAVVAALLEDEGMSGASDVVLSGGSAGGLAVYYHADFVRGLLPASTRLAAAPDAGFFLDAKNLDGTYAYRALFQTADPLWNTTRSGGTDASCLAAQASTPWKCLMAQYLVPHLATRAFVTNSELDIYQLPNILGLKCLPPKCDAQQVAKYDAYRALAARTLTDVVAADPMGVGHGVFALACFVHEINVAYCDTQPLPNCVGWQQYSVNGTSAQRAFGEWFTNSSSWENVVEGCDFPCNPTCPFPPK